MKIIGFLYVKTEILLQNAKLSSFLPFMASTPLRARLDRTRNQQLAFARNCIATVQNVELLSIYMKKSINFDGFFEHRMLEVLRKTIRI